MFTNGGYRILYIDSGAGYLPVGCLTSHSFSEESETLNTTTRDNGGWSTEVPTNQSYSISFDGLVLDNLSSILIRFISQSFVYLKLFSFFVLESIFLLSFILLLLNVFKKDLP